MRGKPHFSDRQLRRWYRSYNQRFFNGVLPDDVDVIWAPEHGCSGVTIHDLRNDDVVIKIDPMFGCDTKRGRIVLVHEMVHVELHPYAGHGVRFQNRMKKLAQAGAFKGIW